MTIYVCINFCIIFYFFGPIDQSTINTDCNSNLKKSDEWNKLYTNKTKYKTILYCTVLYSGSLYCRWEFEAIFRISGD